VPRRAPVLVCSHGDHKESTIGSPDPRLFRCSCKCVSCISGPLSYVETRRLQPRGREANELDIDEGRGSRPDVGLLMLVLNTMVVVFAGTESFGFAPAIGGTACDQAGWCETSRARDNPTDK
jgi:hypothetical protein